MTRAPLTDDVERWLLEQALGDPDLPTLFAGLCARVHAAGTPLARAYLGWTTLHPLFEAEELVWRAGRPLDIDQIPHSAETPEAFLRSPLRHVMVNDLPTLRRRLDGPEALIDFPILARLRDEGLTDYLITSTAFSVARLSPAAGIDTSGMIASWSTARTGGFADADITALTRLAAPFAAAVRTALQNRVLGNLADAYLGPRAGARVLAGAIRRGDGERIRAAIWYADLRGSTRLARALGPDAYLDLLNRYFEATAGSVIEAGGEVLAFVGDAVLAVFPHEGDPRAAALAATAAADAAASRAGALRAPSGEPVRFGLAIGAGEAVFGNVGAPQRLSFTVIGEAVNAVQRMERRGKAIGEPLVASAAIASADPDGWRALGAAELADIAEPVALYARR